MDSISHIPRTSVIPRRYIGSINPCKGHVVLEENTPFVTINTTARGEVML